MGNGWVVRVVGMELGVRCERGCQMCHTSRLYLGPHTDRTSQTLDQTPHRNEHPGRGQHADDTFEIALG